MIRPSPISASVDFEQDGIQHGFLQLPHSRDESAWGSLLIPITVVKNRDGPTVLLTGANHGDEYEGPLALTKLAQQVQANVISGRVIIVPFMNYPAFQAGRRTSPIDDANMNRVFPGAADGTITAQIADYFQRTLLPMADFVLDIHAGGKTLDFVPFGAAHVLENKAQQTRCVAAMHAFGAPYSMMLLELDSRGMYDSAAEAMGKVFVSTELGGGGTATARSVEIAETGVRNFLIHAGVLEGEPNRRDSIALAMPDGRCYITCQHAGLLEPCIDLGHAVAKSDVVARVYDTSRTGVAPFEYRAAIDGILAARHFPGLIQRGDCLAVVAVII